MPAKFLPKKVIQNYSFLFGRLIVGGEIYIVYQRDKMYSRQNINFIVKAHLIQGTLEENHSPSNKTAVESTWTSCDICLTSSQISVVTL